MYVLIHESRDSKRKYTIHYKPNHERVAQGCWTLENEKHERIDIDERPLFDAIHALWEAQCNEK